MVWDFSWHGRDWDDVVFMNVYDLDDCYEHDEYQG